MRSRLRMAALAVAAGVTWASASRAGDPPVENLVHLELQISGLEREGCEIEIKPGHPACQFRPVAKKVERTDTGSPLRLAPIPIQAKSTAADRDCSFTITVKEPGLEPKVFRRGIRLTAPEPGKPAPVQVVKCLLRSPSIAAKDDPNSPRR